MLGQAFRVSQRLWVLGRNEWEPFLEGCCKLLVGSDYQTWVWKDLEVCDLLSGDPASDSAGRGPDLGPVGAQSG